MKARDLIAELMRHDLDLEVFAEVPIVGHAPITMPLDKVERRNDGGAHSPRLVLEAPAEIIAEVEFKFSVTE